MELKNHNEIVGTLSRVEIENGHNKLIFSIMKEIEIPSGAVPIEKLRQLNGSRIGLLNCDGSYKIRKIK